MDSVAIRSSFGGLFFNHSHPEATQSSSSNSFSVLHFPCFNKFRLNNSSNPQSPALKCNNCQKLITPPSNSSPVVRKIRDLASQASTCKWVSIIRSSSNGESISNSHRPSSSNPPSLQNPVPKCNCSSPVTCRTRDLASSISIHKWVSILRRLIYGGSEDLTRGCVQNGGLGMALLSATSTARVRISPFVAALAANPTFVSALFAWFVAQSIKVVLNFFVERKWDLRMLFACGGMPSSHSALCTALTASVAICHGVADSLFPVCLWFSLIVMYDAIGVRRHAGMQAEVLNVIVEDLFQGHPISQRKLKELLGHTPSQVLAGAVLGVTVACICCNGCLAAI